MSDFVYSFANVRRVVKANRDQTKWKKTGWFSSEEYKVEYVTPDHIITQRGGQEEDEHQYLRYDITADAIKTFMVENRKWFSEPEGGGDWVFDETVTEKTEPFLLEATVEETRSENVKFIDYVSNDRSGDKACIFLPSILCDLLTLNTCAFMCSLFFSSL